MLFSRQKSDLDLIQKINKHFAPHTEKPKEPVKQGRSAAAHNHISKCMELRCVGIIIVAIGALIAIGVALWMNWDSVCAWCKQAFQAVGDFF